MDVLVRSQLNSVVQSYIGKQIMILVPSQSLKNRADAAVKGNYWGINT